MNFTKMHGLGNDFVVVDGVRQSVSLTASYIRDLADRRRGVGFDQLLLLEPAIAPDHDFVYRIFNADGSEVAQCGNGARCLALFIRDQKLSDKPWVRLKTASSLLRVHLDSDRSATVEMPAPVWIPERIPFVADCEATTYHINVDGSSIEGGVVSVGNPHFVCQVPELSAVPFTHLAKKLSTHARFPEGANISFVQVLSRGSIKMRIYERGVGETEACGSAAYAAAAVARLWGCVDDDILVQQPGGELRIKRNDDKQKWCISGAVAVVYLADMSN